jgi:predicted aspartyl protease
LTEVVAEVVAVEAVAILLFAVVVALLGSEVDVASWVAVVAGEIVVSMARQNLQQMYQKVSHLLNDVRPRSLCSGQENSSYCYEPR